MSHLKTTNLLGIVANVLPSASTNAEIKDSSKSKKKPTGANPSGIRRQPYGIDADGNKIRQEKENKKKWSKTKEIKIII